MSSYKELDEISALLKEMELSREDSAAAPSSLSTKLGRRGRRGKSRRERKEEEDLRAALAASLETHSDSAAASAAAPSSLSTKLGRRGKSRRRRERREDADLRAALAASLETSEDSAAAGVAMATGSDDLTETKSGEYSSSASSGLLKYTPFTIPNSGVGIDLSHDPPILFTYMCFWLALADGLNRIRFNGRNDWTWYELKDMVRRSVTNNSGELFDIGKIDETTFAKHHNAFEEIASILGVKIKVYRLLKDKETRRNYISSSFVVQSSNDSELVIEILHMGHHFEFITGFGEGSGGAEVPYVEDDLFDIKSKILALKLASSRRRTEAYNKWVTEINESDYHEETKKFILNALKAEMSNLTKDKKYREKYLKYKMKYLKLKKSLA